MGARTKARKSALDVLYAADVRGVPARELLSEPSISGNQARPYTVVLVEGVTDRCDEIDALLGRYSTGWDVDRMPAIDRNLLRIAVFEVVSGQVDAPVAVSEAVALSRQLSTDDSPAFVNGVLGALIASEPAFTAVAVVDDDVAFDDDDADEVVLDADFSQNTEIVVEDDDFGPHYKAP